MSEGRLFREMLDLTVRTVLSAGSALLAATVILGEFVPLPECVKLPFWKIPPLDSFLVSSLLPLL